MKQSWVEKELGEVCRFIDYRGRTPKKTTSGIRLITAKNVKMGYIQEEPLEYVNPDIYDTWMTRGIPMKGDILFTTEAPLANVAQLDTDEKVVFAQRIITLTPVIPDLDRTFLKYLLLSDIVQDRIHSKATGATVKGIKAKLLKTVKIPLPPLPEQKRIVRILDEAFANIEKAWVNTEKNLRNTRALFESYLNDIFTKPKDSWQEYVLGDVCTFIGGSQPPKSTFSKIKKDSYIRLIQIRDYKNDNHIVYIPVKHAKRTCKSDDIMIGRYGPPLFQILRGLDGAYNVALMKAVPDEYKLSHNFLFFFLRHSTIQQYVIYHSQRAAGQSGVNKNTLEPYPITLPTLKEQAHISDKLKDLEQLTNDLLASYNNKIALLDELKKSLLHHAFTGKL